MNLVNAAEREGWRLVGNHLDVVSLANASMVCKLWNNAFGDHPKWKFFYCNSSEYLFTTGEKDGKWRILYGELFNRCKFLMCRTWNIEEHRPILNPRTIDAIYDRCFFVDDKFVVQANGNFFIRCDQITAPKTDNKIRIAPGYHKVAFPDATDDESFHQIRDILIDKNYIYASTEEGPILCWKKNEFPHGFTRIGPVRFCRRPHDFKLQNEILYIVDDYASGSLTAYKNSEVLWKGCISNELNSRIVTNNFLGAILDKDSDITSPYGDLYLWDSRHPKFPQIKVEMVRHFVLLGNEAICVTDDEIIAYSLEGSRLIHQMDCKKLNHIVANTDQDLVYLMKEWRYLITLSIPEKRIISCINLEDQDDCIVTFFIVNIKFFSGILYCVGFDDRLYLVHPKKGIIRKGPSGMFHGPSIEVRNGMVLGVNSQRDAAVILNSR